MVLHLNILKTILTLQENLPIIQDQPAVHDIIPSSKVLVLNDITVYFTCFTTSIISDMISISDEAEDFQ